MAYAIAFLPSAARQLAGLPQDVQRRVGRRVEALAETPRPPGVQALRGEERLLRLRVGDYRVIFLFEDAEQVVVVVSIGHRREVYRGL